MLEGKKLGSGRQDHQEYCLEKKGQFEKKAGKSVVEEEEPEEMSEEALKPFFRN